MKLFCIATYLFAISLSFITRGFFDIKYSLFLTFAIILSGFISNRLYSLIANKAPFKWNYGAVIPALFYILGYIYILIKSII